MNGYRCWACHTETDLDGDCRNPDCPALRDARRVMRISREKLREIDRALNRIVSEERMREGARA